MADLRFKILAATTAIVLTLTWVVFIYAASVVGLDLGVLVTFVATSAVVLAGVVVVGWAAFSRRARKTTE